MGKYSCFFTAFTTATTAKSAIGLHANGAGEWFELLEVMMTGSGTAATSDAQHRATVAKCTFATAGTGTVVTAEPLDDFANASRILATRSFSAEPTTVGATPAVVFGFNQRGGMRWAQLRGDGITMYNANTNKGVVVQVQSNTAGEVDGHAHWYES